MQDIANREMEVLQLLCKGLTDKVIARKLNISTNTVRTHRQNLREKFKSSNTITMIKKAYAMKLINAKY
ncbi:MAG: response regulator transcription factor [Bacteroidetes bacterium]|jgi:DNA-binding NarL/FixJ family response regulator|nr:response regulator transcription factor [Bacteroidota bacterium]